MKGAPPSVASASTFFAHCSSLKRQAVPMQGTTSTVHDGFVVQPTGIFYDVHQHSFCRHPYRGVCGVVLYDKEVMVVETGSAYEDLLSLAKCTNRSTHEAQPTYNAQVLIF